MKIESGKFYQARNGLKVFVGAVGCPFDGCRENQQAVGWICTGDGKSEEATWGRNGEWIQAGNRDDRDLVSIWGFGPEERVIDGVRMRKVEAWVPVVEVVEGRAGE